MVSISHSIKRARFTSVIQTRRGTWRARRSIGLRFFTFSIALSFFFINVPFAASQNRPVPSTPTELTRGDYQSAIDLLNKRLAANPSDEDAERNLLRAFLETGRYAQAESSAKGFLAKHANASRVRHQLGEVYAATGRYVEAAGEFERVGRELIKQTGATPARLESDVRRAEMLL
ncbi:MAG: tetratricopeptide repeat protein, partial [Acidobacteriota bacterium]|nr:tetratricopeptide repeat protein [Acidobacteriota bacterium]